MRTFDEEFERISKSEEGLTLRKKIFMMVETQCRAEKRSLTTEQKQEQIQALSMIRLSQFVHKRKIDEIIKWINVYEEKNGKLNIDTTDEELYNLEEL